MRAAPGAAMLLAAVLATSGGASAADSSQFDFANGLFQRGFYEEAAEEYRAYLDARPQGEHAATALYRLGESAYSAGDLDTAKEAFSQFQTREGSPDRAERARLRIGEIAFRQGRHAEAARTLGALAAEADSPDVAAGALYYFGRAKLGAGEAEAAAQAFDELAKRFPDSPLAPYARYQRAYALLEMGLLADAALEFSAMASSDADERLRMESRFRAAETYDRLGWYDDAVTAYRTLKREFPGSEYADRADYGYAWSLYYAGEFAAAAEAAANYLERRPDSPRAAGTRYLRANCLQNLQRYDEALRVYRRVREEAPRSEFAERAGYKVGWTLYLAGRKEEAQDAILAYLEGRRGSEFEGDAAYLLGSIHEEAGDFAAAYKEFRLVAEKYPESEFGPEALYKSGECLLRLERAEEAETVFREFAERYPEHPFTEDAILRVGDTEFFAAAFDKAVERYRGVLASDPPPEPQVERETLYRLAITYHNMQEYAKSAETFSKLLKRFPDSMYAPEAHFRRGQWLLHDKSDPAAAIEAFERCLQAQPKGAYAGRARKGVAMAHFDAGRKDEAARAFLEVIETYADVSLTEDSYVWTAQYFSDRERWEEAARAYRALLDHAPDYEKASVALFNLAESLEKAGKTEAAMEVYGDVAGIEEPGAPVGKAHLALGRLFASRGESELATDHFEEASRSETADTSAQAYFELGALKQQAEIWEEAARYYMRVAILYAHETLSPEALLRAGACYERAGKPDRAAQAYEELTADFSGSPQAEEARKRLQNGPGAETG